MAKTVDEIIKAQLGALMLEVAILIAKNSALEDRVKELELNVREPDKKRMPAKE